ncbi:MAG TPA: HlyD family efflux transporter periplasmic adaptor subunit [Chloroflexia bacterium]|nr:HlyD family efflux transporter periplasmic adaptor subunit [Chloroflexia bacterium]
MPQKIFREAALERLATPEQLDKLLQVTDRKGWLALAGIVVLLALALLWSIFGTLPRTLPVNNGILLRQGGIQEIRSSETGQLITLRIKAGDQLQAGQVIGELKTEQGATVDLKSPYKGTVLEILAETNSVLKPDAVLARLEETDRPLQAVLLVPLSEGKRLKPGMQAQLSPSPVNAQSEGYLLGTVSYVGEYPVTAEGLQLLLKSKELVESLTTAGPVLKVEVALQADPATFSGFKWTSLQGPDLKLTNGTLCRANLILGDKHPISFILPFLGDKEAA